jgi:hypothetical protein
MARRSNATWLFLAVVVGGAGFFVARAMREPPSAPSANGSTSAAGASANATTSTDAPPSPPGSARSRWFAEGDQVAADPAALPLLGGLQLGSEVIPGWQLVGVSGVREGHVEIMLDGRHEVGLFVWIEKKKADKPAAFQTASYSIFFGGAHPVAVVEAEQTALAKAIRDRVAKSETTVPIPPGL